MSGIARKRRMENIRTIQSAQAEGRALYKEWMKNEASDADLEALAALARAGAAPVSMGEHRRGLRPELGHGEVRQRALDAERRFVDWSVEQAKKGR